MEITDIALIIGTLRLKGFHLKSLPEQHKEGTLIKEEKKTKPQAHQSEIKNKSSGLSENHLLNTGLKGGSINANTILNCRFLNEACSFVPVQRHAWRRTGERSKLAKLYPIPPPQH